MNLRSQGDGVWREWGDVMWAEIQKAAARPVREAERAHAGPRLVEMSRDERHAVFGKLYRRRLAWLRWSSLGKRTK